MGTGELVRAVCLYGFDGSFIGGRHGGRQLMRIEKQDAENEFSMIDSFTCLTLRLFLLFNTS